MITISFLIGGGLGISSAVCALLFTNFGWGTIIAIYFGFGYGVPFALLAVARLIKLQQRTLSATDITRR